MSRGLQKVPWVSLGITRRELCLDNTLPTGQTFRWRKLKDNTYVGVLGHRVVHLDDSGDTVRSRVVGRSPNAKRPKDAVALKEYLNLNTKLCKLQDSWIQADEHYKRVASFIPGARMLRQDPLECLLQFVCSSNNHITRIRGMVERLCAMYGTPLDLQVPPSELQALAEGGLPRFYASPTLQQLAAAREADLRAAGFGYRAKFITGTVKELMAKEEGGEQWLLGLREVPYLEAVEQLCTLPGVGPKVASCVCLFSLDKHAAIPVDTHVWQLAVKHYTPALRGKALTKGVMQQVEQAFVQRFGAYAGWAHNALFISELASHQKRDVNVAPVVSDQDKDHKQPSKRRKIKDLSLSTNTASKNHIKEEDIKVDAKLEASRHVIKNETVSSGSVHVKSEALLTHEIQYRINARPF